MNVSDCSCSLRIQSYVLKDGAMKRILSSLAVLALLASPVATAQSWSNSFSPGQARDAVKDGKNVPLSRIFKQLKREYGGYQLGADLFSTGNGNNEYVIDWMTGDGRKMRFRVDAKTGKILEKRGA
ncbi:MAG: PepSY domain-containing protein [Hyphomonas sp.]